jgi:hypothetical protein
MSKLSLIAIAVAALAFQPTFAADAAKDKTMAKVPECYEVTSMPKPKSAKERADVREAAKAKGLECRDEAAEPDPKSTKARADVKKDTKAAMKAGEIGTTEASTTPKK